MKNHPYPKHSKRTVERAVKLAGLRMYKKVPFYIPELKMTVYCEPAKAADVRKKYLDLHEFNRKTIANATTGNNY